MRFDQLGFCAFVSVETLFARVPRLMLQHFRLERPAQMQRRRAGVMRDEQHDARMEAEYRQRNLERYKTQHRALIDGLQAMVHLASIENLVRSV